MSVHFEKRHANAGVSVIIPSRDGIRGGNVARLLRQIEEQKLADSYELLLVIGEHPNGHARNVGAGAARGSILVFIDDDAVLRGPHVLGQLVECVRIPEVGMAGASTLVPERSNRLQRWLARELPTARYPIVETATDTRDGATHLCCAFRRAVWDQLGGENDLLLSGTDVDMRERVRRAGYRVVLAPGCAAFHPLPETLGSYLRSQYNYGLGAEVFLHECPHFGRAKDLSSAWAATWYLLLHMGWAGLGIFLGRSARGRYRLHLHPLQAMGSVAYSLGYRAGFHRYISSGLYAQAQARVRSQGWGWDSSS
ncbi:MAG: glycosyltransferase [Chlamydiota bacterium]